MDMEDMTGTGNERHPFRQICIYHYFTRSKEEYAEKLERGNATSRKERGWEDFEIFDRNEVRDDGICDSISARRSHRRDLWEYRRMSQEKLIASIQMLQQVMEQPGSTWAGQTEYLLCCLHGVSEVFPLFGLEVCGADSGASFGETVYGVGTKNVLRRGAAFVFCAAGSHETSAVGGAAKDHAQSHGMGRNRKPILFGNIAVGGVPVFSSDHAGIETALPRNLSEHKLKA